MSEHDEQPRPIKNERPAVQDLVISDINRRKAIGIERYGNLLQSFNGRNGVRDAYEEAQDLTIYLRQVQDEFAQIARVVERLAARVVDASLAEIITDPDVLDVLRWANSITGNASLAAEQDKRGPHEPGAGPAIVRPVVAHVSERIKITWVKTGGERHVEIRVAPEFQRETTPHDRLEVNTLWIHRTNRAPVVIVEHDGSGVFYRHTHSGDCLTCVNSRHGHHHVPDDFRRDFIPDRRTR